MNAREEAVAVFLTQCGWGAAERMKLAGDASFRRYVRLRRGGETAMLMDAPAPHEDVRPYVAAARHLFAQGYAAPMLLAVDEAEGFVLMEDLGDGLFTRVLQADGAGERDLYEAAVDLLAEWPRERELCKQTSTLALGDYDEEAYQREAALFTDWFLPEILGHEKAAALKEEYRALWRELLREAALRPQVFVHRDYHADNLLRLPGGRVGLLDFQDALWGHAAYDLVSLLEDARRDVSPDLAQTMFRRYMRNAEVDEEKFLHAYSVLGAQRNLKILGIFVRLFRRDGKPHYLKHLPRVWRHLKNDLKHPALAPLQRWMQKNVPADAAETLAHG